MTDNELGPLQLWRVQYEDQSRDCDGTYLLDPWFVFATHPDEAWNESARLYDTSHGLPVIGAWDARPATPEEAAHWLARAAALGTSFKFTDEQWRAYQAIPEQGYSHRSHLEWVFNSWLRGGSDD